MVGAFIRRGGERPYEVYAYFILVNAPTNLRSRAVIFVVFLLLGRELVDS